jgi:putative two-component system hydrogenase maturation factor HypX/HoxX
MLALAADQVWCRGGAVLNPHYRLMGLHGSEYWTYTLPRRVGAAEAARLTEGCLPVSSASALHSGLVDRAIAGDPAGYREQVAVLAEGLARSRDYAARLAAKERWLAGGSGQRRLAGYRAAELAIMRGDFSGAPYAQLRRAFVYKDKPTCTPPHLARHRIAALPAGPARPRARRTASVVGS